MKFHYYLLVAAALLSGVRGADNSSAPAAAAAQAEPAIERAYLHTSATELVAAVKPLEAALAAEPKNPALLYERAFAHYAAVATLRAKKDTAAMIAELEKAGALLDDVKGQPWEGEAAALHSTILGQLIGFKGGMAGMTLGPKSGKLMDRATKSLTADNPRVLLFRGLSLYSTPAMYGGDPAKGMALLQQAVDAFAKADAATPGPHWGQVDALTWLGIAKQKAGDAAAARAAWEQALALEPDDGWVKFALLPSLAAKSGK